MRAPLHFEPVAIAGDAAGAWALDRAGTLRRWPGAMDVGLGAPITALAEGVAGDAEGRVWRLASAPARVGAHAASVGAVDLAPGEGWIASGCRDGVVGVWHAAAAEGGRLVRAHRGPVRRVAFAPSGGALLSVDAERAVLQVPDRRPASLRLAVPAVDAAWSADHAVWLADEAGEIHRWSGGTARRVLATHMARRVLPLGAGVAVWTDDGLLIAVDVGGQIGAAIEGVRDAVSTGEAVAFAHAGGVSVLRPGGAPPERVGDRDGPLVPGRPIRTLGADGDLQPVRIEPIGTPFDRIAQRLAARYTSG